MLALRPYQADGIARARASVEAGNRRVLICLPTGGGKTIIASSIIRSAYEMGRRSIFIAHRREILGQTFGKLVAAGIPEREVGVIMAGDPRRRPGALVQVASVDTLRNREIAAPDLVFIDEAHRALAASYVSISARWPEAVHVGLTATPTRLDGKGMADAYDDLVQVASISQLIADGFLAQPRVFTVPAGSMPDLKGVKSTGGDFNGRQLAERVNTGALVGDIVEHWLAKAEGRRTVCFAVSVDHSRAIVERFCARGVTAEHLDGETPEDERAAILRRLEAGVTRVVSNVMVLTEGWDMPCVKVLIAARPTQSLVVWLQQAGRILRPWQGEVPLILDHAGCARMHGLPHEDRDWSLEPTRKKRSKGEVDCAKLCDECLAVVPLGARVCPECGAEMPWREQDLTEGEGELEEVLAISVRLVDEYNAMVDAWREENARRMARPDGRPMKPGVLFHRWKQAHGGRPPPRGCKRPKLTPEEQARIDEHEARRAAPVIVPAPLEDMPHVRARVLERMDPAARAAAEQRAAEQGLPVYRSAVSW